MEKKSLVIPDELAEYVNDDYEDVSCYSKSKTYHFKNGVFLKIDNKNELYEEYKMTSLFYHLGIGTKVIQYFSSEKDYLLTEQVDGEDLTKLTDNPNKLCKILADGLRILHSQPIQEINISKKYKNYIDIYNSNIRNKNLEEYEIIHRKGHLLKCDTLIHGDACLPNIISKEGSFKAFIDTGLAGLGDKHIDLYWALWSLEYNLQTGAYNDKLLSLYGLEYSKEILEVIKAFEIL